MRWMLLIAVLLGVMLIVRECGQTAPAVGVVAAPRRTPTNDVREEPDGAEHSLRWGLYRIYWGRDYRERLQAELDRFASAPDDLMFYRDLSRGYPAEAVAAIRERGATPIVSLELWHWHDRERRSELASIVAGEYDEFFSGWAADAAREGGRVLLRFGFEMNGEWFSWSGDPPAFVAAWRHVHRLFDQQGAGNVEWVFCPNVVSIPHGEDNAASLYDPGDEWIDWVALDGYNFGDDHDAWHHWESFAAIFEEPLRELIEQHPGRPVLIGESGCAPGPRRADWIRDAYAWLQGWPQVKGLIWFDHSKSREGEPDWRIDTSAASLTAFNETFAAP